MPPYRNNMALPFTDLPCSVIVRNNYDTQGVGSMTRASVAQLTPTQLEALFKPSGLFADMDAWFRASFEMKACGIKTNGLYEWLMSSYRPMGNLLNAEKIDRGPSLLMPFVLARQDSIINKDYWAITNGWSVTTYDGLNSDLTTYPLTNADLALAAGTDRVIRVVTRYGFDLNAEWFSSRDVVYIMGRAGGISMQGNWKVLASEVSPDLSYIDVVITSQNAGSAAHYDAAPTSGVLLAGGNNVNDFESFCLNRPTLDPRKRVPFWYQTERRARKVDSEYMTVFARLMESNKYFQEFGDLPLAERNRQDEEEFQKRWVNDFFFGKSISANQTLANWQSLEAINTITSAGLDPGLGGKQIAYRANMIGIREQMLRCGRVKDLQNNPLNLQELLMDIYNITRARKSQGRTADSIDIYTNQPYAALFESAMIAYWKQEYSDIARIEIKTGTNELGFVWRSYITKYPAGVTINVITHEFFDDYRSAFETESIASRGNLFLILDMGKPGAKGGTIYPGIIATNTKKRTLGELEKLAAVDATFACVMEHVTEEIMLSSVTTTAVVECPQNSLWVENMADVVPIVTGPVANATYTNLY